MISLKTLYPGGIQTQVFRCDVKCATPPVVTAMVSVAELVTNWFRRSYEIVPVVNFKSLTLEQRLQNLQSFEFEIDWRMRPVKKK
jgi:hypothetical protein